MTYASSRPLPLSVKIVVAGGFATGKTTLVGTVSEVPGARTEELMTELGRPVDDLSGVPAKTTTTVSSDFGRLTLAEDIRLYLFGTPGQDRYLPLWTDLTRGAAGAVVLVDTRRIEACYPPLEFFEAAGIPYAVAVNQFEDDTAVYPLDEVREALDLPPYVPLQRCDARDRDSCVDVLISLVAYLAPATPAHDLQGAHR
jgi:signal recognition particle receptor subunit beta